MLAVLVRGVQVRVTRPAMAFYLDVLAHGDLPPDSDFSSPTEADLAPDVEAALTATTLGRALSRAAG